MRRAAAVVVRAVVVAASFTTACAEPFPSDDDDDDVVADAGPDNDGGGGGDAPPPFCDASITLQPASPVAPLVMLAAVELNAAPYGVITYSWTVSRFDGGSEYPVDWTPRNDDATEIEIDAQEPGVYSLVADVHDEREECEDAFRNINVQAAGALSDTYQMRFVPGPSVPAPAQQTTITIPGGAEFALGGMTLDGGLLAGGALVDDAGSPVSGYLRFTPIGGGPMIELFAGADGAWAVVLADSTYDVLVIPTTGALPPRSLQIAADWDLEPFVLDPGTAISGVVVDAAGDPIAGATISMRVAGTPSTLAVTDAAGAFTIRARPPGLVDVTVVPPAASGRPRLDVAGLSLAEGAPLTIRFAATPTRSLAGIVLQDAASIPLEGATLSALANQPAAGTVDDGVAPVAMSGSVRASAIAGPGGVLPALILPALDGYRGVVELAGAPARTVAFGLAAAAPPSITAAATVPVSGTVSRPSGAPAADVRVVAAPAAGSDLAGVASAIAADVTDAAGGFAFALAPDTAYELIFSPRPSASVGPARSALSVAASPLVVDTALPAALQVSGTVQLPGLGGLGGVSIQMLCSGLDCPDGVDSSRPVAEAISSSDGDFVLVVPDPGVD